MDLLAQIPPDVLCLYRRAFAFCHPTVVSLEEAAMALQDFLSTTVPADLADLLSDPLLVPMPRAKVFCPGQPVLPDLPDCTISYQRF